MGRDMCQQAHTHTRTKIHTHTHTQTDTDRLACICFCSCFSLCVELRVIITMPVVLCFQTLTAAVSLLASSVATFTVVQLSCLYS